MDFAGDFRWTELVAVHTSFNLSTYDQLTLNLISLSCVRASSVYSILLLLLRTSTNFKIRINAAAALAVPKSRLSKISNFYYIHLALLLLLTGKEELRGWVCCSSLWSIFYNDSTLVHIKWWKIHYVRSCGLVDWSSILLKLATNFGLLLISF